jgi:FkbM family methyltransferase
MKTINDNLRLFKKDPEKNFTFSPNFDWGELTYSDIITIEREIINENVYRYWRDVKENDIVMDIGSSVGPFVCSILENKPSKVYCVEPSKTLIKTMEKNCSEYLINYEKNPLVYINNGIVRNIGDSINIFGLNKKFTPITFKDLIKTYSINKINFLKIDCEGGEYDIFLEENMNFLLNNVEFISMEVHINLEGYREKFKKFRDEYLVQFHNYEVISCTRQNISYGNSVDIKELIFDNAFIDEYTCEFMIYIYNEI